MYYVKPNEVMPQKSDFETYDVIDLDKLENIHSNISLNEVKKQGYIVSSDCITPQKSSNIVVKRIFDKESFDAKKEIYDVAHEKAYNDFRMRLADEHQHCYGDPLDDLIYAIAYEKGHGSGYNEVANYYTYFDDFAIKVIEALEVKKNLHSVTSK